MLRVCLSVFVLAACLSAQPFAQGAASGVELKGAKPATIVNLNSATAAQIADLPGIGVKTAELIVQYRVKNGPFKKIEEVMNVRGVGEKSFLRIKDRLSVAEPKGGTDSKK